MARQNLDDAVARVVDAGNCSGCGGCTLLDQGLAMRLADDGFLRPVRERHDRHARADAAQLFASVCPGRRVDARRPAGVTVHPTLGPVLSSWRAHAADPETRHRGSSGGVLTALVSWLTQSGEVPAFGAACADPTEPRRTVSVGITSRDDALAAAGSRYAPVSVLSSALTSEQGLVAKPCEVSAARAWQAATRPGQAPPLLLSFFCAGTPSQLATDDLVAALGAGAPGSLRDLWYRGRGWPGRFTAVTAEGARSASYEESWGAHLGPATQWRCKICPDGVGESADIAAADHWRTDTRGYPDFAEGDGWSAVLARTPRGHDIVLRAIAEGVLVAEPLDLDDLAAVQPLQVLRRSTLLGRLSGTVAAGGRVPRYRGFGLRRLALQHPVRTLRTARGSFRRVRRRRQESP